MYMCTPWCVSYLPWFTPDNCRELRWEIDLHEVGRSRAGTPISSKQASEQAARGEPRPQEGVSALRARDPARD